MAGGLLGRREPTDDRHVAAFPFSAVRPLIVAKVEEVLPRPRWARTHQQAGTSSCVGHGIAMERAITNRLQGVLAGLISVGRRYNPIMVWEGAKAIDEWSDTVPGDNNGTSVRAGYEWVRLNGLAKVRTMKVVNDRPTPVGEKPVSEAEGVITYRWARTVDEIRTAIAAGVPVTIGVSWYSGFDSPEKVGSDYMLPDGITRGLGTLRGGHCVCLRGASDRRQAFLVENSWGDSWPPSWLPYLAMERLLREHGEAALVTDR